MKLDNCRSVSTQLRIAEVFGRLPWEYRHKGPFVGAIADFTWTTAVEHQLFLEQVQDDLTGGAEPVRLFESGLSVISGQVHREIPEAPPPKREG